MKGLGMEGRPPLAAFAGQWTVARTIDDLRAGQVSEFSGQAHLCQSESGLLYREAGRIELGNGHSLAAERRYLWSETAQGIEVRFDDGRFFHVIGAGTQVSVAHDCTPDSYVGAYDFAAWPEWRISWTVEGPRKSYRMRSTYRRA